MYVALSEARTDRGRVPYTQLDKCRWQFIMCADLDGIVARGTKIECPGISFILTPGDTMSIKY